MLDRLSVAESDEVLRRLLKFQPALREQAAEIATALVTDIDAARIAEELSAAILGLDILDLAEERGGAQPWDYVEPVEAAWELLSARVEPYISNAVRLAELRLDEAACAACRGTILGLYAVRDHVRDNDLLGLASDFPDEAAADALSRFRRALGRRRGKNVLLAQVIAGIDDWPELEG